MVASPPQSLQLTGEPGPAWAWASPPQPGHCSNAGILRHPRESGCPVWGRSSCRRNQLPRVPTGAERDAGQGGGRGVRAPQAPLGNGEARLPQGAESSRSGAGVSGVGSGKWGGLEKPRIPAVGVAAGPLSSSPLPPPAPPPRRPINSRWKDHITGEDMYPHSTPAQIYFSSAVLSCCCPPGPVCKAPGEGEGWGRHGHTPPALGHHSPLGWQEGDVQIPAGVRGGEVSPNPGWEPRAWRHQDGGPRGLGCHPVPRH